MAAFVYLAAIRVGHLTVKMLACVLAGPAYPWPVSPPSPFVPQLVRLFSGQISPGVVSLITTPPVPLPSPALRIATLQAFPKPPRRRPPMLDPQLFSDLFARHAAPVSLYARQFDRNDPDELVQEAFLRLLALPRPPPEVRPWLLLTIRRLALDRRKSWFRRLRRESVAARPDLFTPDPAAPLDARLAARHLLALPARQREIVVLRLWNDLTFAQIAELLHLSDSTVHTDYTTALATLHRSFEPAHAPRPTIPVR